MTQDHWNEHARRWRHIGPPLRPTPEDIRILRAVLAAEPEPRQALVLGVTPEIVGLGWPTTVHLLSIDRNPSMIRHVLPRPRGLKLSALCADWRSLPLAEHSVDLILGDGPLTAFDPFGDHERWIGELRRVLRPGGGLVLRQPLRPKRPSPVGEVFADLRAGRLPSFTQFKVLLLQALHGSFEQGVRTAAAWEAWRNSGLDPAELSRALGWPEDEIRTIEAYRDSKVVYLFPTAAELAELLADGFCEVARHVPAANLGELSPTVVFHAR